MPRGPGTNGRERRPRRSRGIPAAHFQGCEGLNVQVVSGLIEQQQVTALLEGQRQVQTVTLTTGEHTRLLLLVRALEAERGNVRTRRHLNVADLDVVQTVRDDLPEALLRVDVRAVLVNVRDLHGLADLQLAAVEGLQANDGLEQGGLTHTVRTNHTHNAVTGQGEGQTVNQGTAVEAFCRFSASITTLPRRGPGGI